jgi:general secretion pathway protein H
MRTSRADHEAGFTLLELLAVLVILALAGTAVLRTSQHGAETARVRAFLTSAEAMMRDARTRAIETQTETEVILDTEDRRLLFPLAGRVLEVPKNVSLEGTLARLPADSEGRFAIRFFPTGSATGAVLNFRYQGQNYELRVNWLTGNADVQRS